MPPSSSVPRFFSKPYQLAGAVVILATAILFYTLKKAPIRWVPLQKGPIVEAIYGLATVTSEREYRVKPGVMGTLQNVYVREGDRVQAGQPLLQIEDQPAVRAPFAGVITAIPFKKGENIFPQLPVLSMLDPERLYLSMAVEQASALRIRRGQKAYFSFESLPQQRFSAEVSALIPKEGLFTVHLAVTKFPEGVLPGMTADTSIIVGEKSGAVLIPLEAVQSVQASKANFRVAGKSESRTLKLGIVNEKSAELLEPQFENPEAVEIAVANAPAGKPR